MLAPPRSLGKSLTRTRTDIDYMNQYRDFDNDAIRFNYSVGETFLNALHASGRHYVPIIDSAIYVPNPNNASDGYACYFFKSPTIRILIFIDIQHTTVEMRQVHS